ncbi:MAG: hypothetical protein ACRD59_17675 [Candidatus Acidiferrales bacterium]
MAEWLSTNFFQAAETAANGANSDFCEIESAFAERANEIRNSAENQQHPKTKTEKQFRREKLTDEVELENKGQCDARQQPFAHFRFFNDANNECFQLPQKHFH